LRQVGLSALILKHRDCQYCSNRKTKISSRSRGLRFDWLSQRKQLESSTVPCTKSSKM